MFEKLSETKYTVSGKLSWAKVFLHNYEHRLKFMSKEKDYEDLFMVDLEMSPEDFAHMSFLRTNKDIKQDFRKDKKTGKILFQFKRYVVMSVPSSDDEKSIPTNPPLVIDAEGNPMDGSTLIGNDSEGIISFLLVPVNKDETAFKVVLNGIKVTKLVEYKKGTAPPPPPVDVDCFGSGSDKEIPF